MSGITVVAHVLYIVPRRLCFGTSVALQRAIVDRSHSVNHLMLCHGNLPPKLPPLSAVNTTPPRRLLLSPTKGKPGTHSPSPATHGAPGTQTLQALGNPCSVGTLQVIGPFLTTLVRVPSSARPPFFSPLGTRHACWNKQTTGDLDGHGHDGISF